MQLLQKLSRIIITIILPNYRGSWQGCNLKCDVAILEITVMGILGGNGLRGVG